MTPSDESSPASVTGRNEAPTNGQLSLPGYKVPRLVSTVIPTVPAEVRLEQMAPILQAALIEFSTLESEEWGDYLLRYVCHRFMDAMWRTFRPEEVA